MTHTGRAYTSPRGLGTIAAMALLLAAAAPVGAIAQTVTAVANLDGATTGSNPAIMALTEGLDGNLYGTTEYGGAHGVGTVFKLAGGTLTDLHDFGSSMTDGQSPYAGLVLATNGKLYGNTQLGGKGWGTAFSITTKGKLTTIYDFCSATIPCAGGIEPVAPFIQGSDGKLYGVAGGSTSITGNGGAAFNLTKLGVQTLLHGFSLGGDGFDPFGPLLQATDGNFYGTTRDGGASDEGTVYKLTGAGVETILYSFAPGNDYTNGGGPYGGLVQGPDGSFFGTASGGGSPGGGGGVIFKIASKAPFTLTKLYTFKGYFGDGANPVGTLVMGSDGNLYGTTQNGGSVAAACNCGTLFSIAPDGSGYRLLFSFPANTDGTKPFGSLPMGGLVQSTDGSFYGVTTRGGLENSTCLGSSVLGCGVVYNLSLGLPPFVKMLPGSGKVGNTIILYGQHLAGATSVSFNGVAAPIIPVSATEIKTTVPVGATTGTVQVVTPARTLSSNVPFQVH